MSYTRRYNGSVPYSGSKTETFSYSYPASQNGGSGSKTVTVYYSGNEPVTIDINVDTTPFDSSVNDCERQVDVLTGSVVATQAAQINEINNSAQKISGAIINGFFSTVKSEISQQIAALENEINSTLLHLREAVKKVLALKAEMEKDYGRIAERYIKLFDDLNNELENRIWELDKSVFDFEKLAEKNTSRVLGSDLTNTVGIFGKENVMLSAKISIGSAKERAYAAIEKARNFLALRKQMDNIILGATVNEAKERIFYASGCFLETGDKSFNVYLTDENNGLKDYQIEKNVKDKFKDKNLKWDYFSEEECKQISVHLNACINEKYNSSEPRIKRVRDMVQKLVNLQGVQICRN